MKRETFTEEEARHILARAAERHEAAERARLGGGTGVSLSELKEIAGEVGIDASHVQAAAGELVLRADASPPSARLGIPAELSEVRMLPGSVSDRQWEQMVGVFRDAFDRPGMTTQFGDVREWVSTNDTPEGMPVRIRLDPGDDGTLLELRQPTEAVLKISGALAGSFGLMGVGFAGFLAASNFAGPPWAIAALLIGLGVASGVGGWLSGRAFVKKRASLFQAVADKAELIGRPEDE